jgi:hypothetical protein
MDGCDIGRVATGTAGRATGSILPRRLPPGASRGPELRHPVERASSRATMGDLAEPSDKDRFGPCAERASRCYGARLTSDEPPPFPGISASPPAIAGAPARSSGEVRRVVSTAVETLWMERTPVGEASTGGRRTTPVD